jgi:hypothetical protein
MKNILLVLLVLAAASSYAQSPEQFNYQAVVRDNSGNVIINQAVQFQISILQTSSVGVLKYRETHLDTTNGFGLISLQIGSGIVDSGSMSSILWGTDIHVMKIEFDPTGGTSWELLSTTQLLSVPYAMHANTASYAKDEDADSTNEIQTLSLINDTLFLSNGGSVIISSSAPSEP